MHGRILKIANFQKHWGVRGNRSIKREGYLASLIGVTSGPCTHLSKNLGGVIGVHTADRNSVQPLRCKLDRDLSIRVDGGMEIAIHIHCLWHGALRDRRKAKQQEERKNCD